MRAIVTGSVGQISASARQRDPLSAAIAGVAEAPGAAAFI